MKKGRCKKAWKAKTPVEITQQLETNAAPCQHRLINGSVPTDGP